MWEDLHKQVLSQKPKRLIVFVIDTSDSMAEGPEGRMSAGLGAIVSLAATAYLNRDMVSLITFRDHAATLVVPPTTSVTRIRQQTSCLPVGGATPLAAGLLKARQVVRQAKLKDSLLTPLLVLLSDGIATTSMRKGVDPTEEALSIAHQIRGDNVAAMVINTLSSNTRSSCILNIAEALGGSSHHVHHLQYEKVLELIENNGL